MEKGQHLGRRPAQRGGRPGWEGSRVSADIRRDVTLRNPWMSTSLPLGETPASARLTWFTDLKDRELDLK